MPLSFHCPEISANTHKDLFLHQSGIVGIWPALHRLSQNSGFSNPIQALKARNSTARGASPGTGRRRTQPGKGGTGFFCCPESCVAPSGLFPSSLQPGASLSRAFSAGLFLFLVCLIGTGWTKGNSQIANQRTADSVTYTDGIGRQVRLPKHPVRIISLAPDVTETLYLLGAQDRLIGNTTWCNWPEAAKHKPKIGDLLNPNYEVILAAKPDLVIASTAGNEESAVLKLTGMGIPVYVSAPRSVEGIFQSVEKLGQITDCEAQGRQLVVQMKDRLNKVQQRIAGLPPVRAFFITWFDPLLAPGKDTFENEAIRWAGVISITSEIRQFYPRYSLEQVLVQDPDVILSVEHKGDPIPDLKKMAGWRNLRAVKEGRVYFLGEFVQHPSPLFIDGVEELARKLHPERFQ